MQSNPREAKSTPVDRLITIIERMHPWRPRLIAMGLFAFVFLLGIVPLMGNAGTELTGSNHKTPAEAASIPVWQQEIRQVFYPGQRNLSRVVLRAQVDNTLAPAVEPRYDVRIFHLTEDREVFHEAVFLSELASLSEKADGSWVLQLPAPVFEAAYSSFTLVIQPLPPFPAAPALQLGTWSLQGDGEILTSEQAPQAGSLQMEWIHRRSLRALWGLLAAVGVLGLAVAMLLSDKPQRNFAMIALVMGCVFCFANPMFGAYDECAHFVRAFDISEGHLMVQRHPEGYGMQIPDNLYDFALRRYHFREMALDRLLLNQDSPPSDVRFFNDFVVHGRTYTPLNYLPQVLGIWLANLFGGSILWQGYIGRVLGLLAYVGLCWAAIRAMPARKTTMMALGLLPMLLLTGASLSQDGVMIGALLLFCALCFRSHMSATGSIGWRQLLPLVLLPLLAIPSKYVYAPFLLLALTIPTDRYVSKTQKRALWLGCAAVLAVGVVWTLMTTMAVSGAGMGGKLSELLRSPWIFLQSAAYTIARDGGSWLLRWNDQPWLWGWESAVTLLAPVALGVTCALDEGQLTAGKAKKWMVLGFVAIVGLVLLAGYMIWNQSTLPYYIEGIQGRYFLPALPLLVFALPLPKRKRQIARMAALGCLLVLTINLVNGIVNMY